MRKFYSEACEVIYQDAVANFEIGAITEAELREFEADAFIEVVSEVDEANETAEELISLSQLKNQK